MDWGWEIQLVLYEFTRLKLNRHEFDNLVFMGEPPWWREDEEWHRFLIDICYKPLKEVGKKVIERSGLQEPDRIPVKIFDSIDITAKNEKGGTSGPNRSSFSIEDPENPESLLQFLGRFHQL